MHRISRAKLAINHFPIFRSILPAKAFSSRAKRKFFSLSSSPRYRGAAFTITHLVDVMRQMPTPPSLPPSPFSNIAFDFPRNFRFHRKDRWSANRICHLSTISNHSLRHFLCHFPHSSEECVTTYRVPTAILEPMQIFYMHVHIHFILA